MESLGLDEVDLKKRFCSVFDLVILNAILLRDFKLIGRTYRQIPPRYRRPWYRSVGLHCAFSVWRSGFRHLKSRISRAGKNR